jgi:TetR/AcrR family transcriptional repressor of nem operon
LDSTRDRLVFTALTLFSEKGYQSTSVADILKAAGANSGSLYHAFPTKQDLLLAVLEMYRDGIEPMLLAPAWAGVEDPIERVFALLGAYRRSLDVTDCLSMGVRSAAWRWSCTSPTRRCAKCWRPISTGGEPM